MIKKLRNVLTEKVPKTRAKIKYNSSLGAILCSKCGVIIKVGREFSEIEWMAMRGEWNLKAQYCKECKK